MNTSLLQVALVPADDRYHLGLITSSASTSHDPPISTVRWSRFLGTTIFKDRPGTTEDT
jgi:hypothetical protein